MSAPVTTRQASRPPLVFLIVVAVLLFVLIALAIANWVRNGALQEELQAGSQQLQLYAAYIEGELARFESLPALMATNQRVIKVLQQPDNASARQALNEYLEQSAKATGALDVYLMNADGLTVSASNWQSEAPFIGRNFGFRPYFRQAMQGELGRYYALGTTSGVRGYYFAHPVYILGKVSGVVVVKLDVAVIESQWSGRQGALLVSDPDGIVFISTVEAWRYLSMRPLSPAALKRIKQSARYPGIEHRTLAVRESTPFEQAWLVVLDEAAMSGRFMRHDRQMPKLGWTAHLLRPLRPVRRRVFDSLVVTFSTFVVLALLMAVMLQRRLRREERRRADQAARLALEKAHGELEQRVVERTADLSREVEERRRAEEALRTAQEELVQAAKLATLGQMSASINHELNQPLTAIRSYADNARLLLERQRYGDVAANMQQIAQLVDRMAQISSQLKMFARKSSGQRVPVVLRNELEVALKILDAEIQSANVRVQVELGEQRVLADATRLEQVLVNLVGNAVHALEGTDSPCVCVRAQKAGGRLQIAIQDNGPGIPEEHLEQIFDPFFTTRKSGLGLGLAISQHIVENMGGRLDAANAQGGGAVFTLTLDIAE